MITSTASEAADVEEQLREALRTNAVKIMDLFIEWDTDGDHKVSKQEFRKAMAAIGFTHSRPHIDSVFASLDDDGSGFIGAGEFARFMKRGEDWESSGWKRGARKIKAVGAMRGKT